MDELQILVCKIIPRKPEFREDANEQLKSQFTHKLKDPYYAAIARRMLQSSEHSESFTQFWGHLAMMVGGRSKSGKTSSHTAVIETSSYAISEEAGEHKLSKNSRQRQRKIEQQASQISSLEAQKPTARVGEDSTLLPQQKQARQNLLSSTVSQPVHDMQLAACKFCKLHKSKINKLKGGYSATANLIFQSWLKDIRVHVEDRNLTEREAM